MPINWMIHGAEITLELLLEPEVNEWELVSHSADGSNGIYSGNGYELEFLIRQSDGRSVVEFSLRRHSGQEFVLNQYVLSSESSTIGLDRIWIPWFLDRHVELVGLERYQRTSRDRYRRWRRGEAYMEHSFAMPAQTMADRGIPIIVGLNRDGTVNLAVAFLDQRIETDMEHMAMTHVPGDQKRGTMRCWLKRPLDGYTMGTMTEHRDGIFVARRSLWFDTLELLRSDYDRWTDRRQIPSPDAAWEPLWAPWGAIKGRWKNMRPEALGPDEIRDMGRIGSELGIRGIINWMSWSTDDLESFKKEQFVWAFPDFIGDFVASSKFPRLKSFLDEMREIGIMSMFWISPWIVGRQTKARQGVREALVEVDVDQSDEMYNVYTSYLCPRNPTTQKYVIDMITQVMKTYGPDGFTVDMVDSSSMHPCTAAHEHNYESVGLAVADTLARIRETIDAFNPNAVIEFRPGYSNISNVYNATAHRSVDSGEGGSYDLNRRHCLLLRSYIPPGVAVHNDPVWWHIEEKNETVAKMLSTMVVSGVPQIGVDLINMNDDHRLLVSRWLSFYQDHKNDFRYGRMRPVQNDPLFSTIKIEHEGKAFVSFASYPALRVPLSEDAREIYLFNCTDEDSLYVLLMNVKGRFSSSVHNYDHEEISQSTSEAENGSLLVEAAVPQGGFVVLRRR